MSAWKRLPGEKGRPGKYGSRKTVLDGIAFDSRREAERWAELCLLERAGEIHALRRQVAFELVPAQKAVVKAGGRAETVTERAVTYIADFVYQEGGETVVEDAKGFRTPEYVIKRKLMLERHGIAIREV